MVRLYTAMQVYTDVLFMPYSKHAHERKFSSNNNNNKCNCCLCIYVMLYIVYPVYMYMYIYNLHCVRLLLYVISSGLLL